MKSGTVKAIIFGLLFGFLLQKGGVGKLHLLIGALLLEDFTVLRVMLSAILVGMFGAMVLTRLGWAEYSIKPTRWRANIGGGLVFGAGFAFSGYCPGTGAAAIGQGNGDAWFMAIGMVVGSYIYALASRQLETHLKAAPADSRRIRLPDVFRLGPLPFAVLFAAALVGVLLLLDRFTV
ncbi:YeeE/YedE thiosulfate transporter family protein [Pelagicoccus sp. SDUM812002]|uniref:YeeE/YedE thiosulfate transporter family protein n=1 Tax=Pelagicoccus sp. SDUM812002 TaxID=3041266 RepID=UPI00280DA8B3|nr:YeeE/YedE thiosulfate transporter family protein [Pelagicoccus sp. SDUM812002]MDQ8184132.1 YeeE/YedE thiosulfate transporter family protein [Pelagicoccus sp. SDUM812002]